MHAGFSLPDHPITTSPRWILFKRSSDGEDRGTPLPMLIRMTMLMMRKVFNIHTINYLALRLPISPTGGAATTTTWPSMAPRM
jgi:hypothetical protein